MANKREKEKRAIQNKQNAFEKQCKQLNVFYIVAICISAVMLLCYFFNWVYIYNTSAGVGIEVRVSGWSFSVAALSGKFTSSNKVYGDLAVPFNYYARLYCEKLATVTLISLITAILSLGANIFLLIKPKHIFSAVPAVLSLASTILLFVCFGIALSMKNSDILPVYCSGNPACFIRSLAIIPAIVALLSTAVPTYIFIRYLKIARA